MWRQEREAVDVGDSPVEAKRPDHESERRARLVERALAERRPSVLDRPAVTHLQRVAGNDVVTASLLAEQAAGGDHDEAEHGGETDDDRSGHSPVLDVVGHGGGQPLDSETRAEMERHLGSDFSDVRVHAGGAAAASASAVGAQAYTVGSEIVFGDGAYHPGSARTQRTLAHELTHVVQQRQGPVDAAPAAGGIAVSHPSDRFEQAAEASAERVMARMQAGAPVQRLDGPSESAMGAEEEEKEVPE